MKKFIFSIFILFVFTQAGCTPPANVSITKDVPIEINSGNTFSFTITVDNQDNQKHELRSIDIDNTFLKGIYIVSTTPDIKEEYNVFGQQIHEFKKDIPESSKENVVFTAKAIKPGDFSGDLDVCIDGDASCLNNSIRIIVN